MKFKKIYVFCPNDFVSGGPDALHQLVYYLKSLGCDAEMVYFAFSDRHHFLIPDAYSKYISHFITEREFVDDAENAVVLPEFAVEKQGLVKKSKVFVWWLSVDYNCNRSSVLWKVFYFATLPARVVKNFDYYKKRFSEAIVKTLQKRAYSFKAELDNVEHLCPSYYALDFVKNRSTKGTHLCIEPISKIFLDEFDAQKGGLDDLPRSDEILYNPRKSGAFVQKLATMAPDLKFTPLTGLTQEELVEKYKTSKLYIDFGPFPGAERMPKEAVLFGCVVITGRLGASNYHGDVPISDEYKFANPAKEKDQIINKIRDILERYSELKNDFNEYRNTVLSLEQNFLVSLKEMFQ